MTMYNDLYVRDALNDDGTIPYQGATAYLSPDIIPAQLQVIAPSTLINSYNTNPTDTNINTQQTNNIYVRAKNLSTSPASGTMKLYYAPSSLLLTPSQWINNAIRTTGGQSEVNLVDANGSTSITPSGIAVGSSAFGWVAPPVPQGYHYCLIGQIVTSSHPNSIPPSFASSSAFTDWVVNNPGICWRNVSIVPATLPAYQQGANFTNLDPAAEEYMFIVNGTNWPINTTVNIQSTGTTFHFGYTQNFGSPATQQNVTTIQTVPASYTGSVLLTLTPPPGSTVPTNATVQFVFAKYTSGSQDAVLKRYARDATFYGVQGNLATAQVVRLGECFLMLGS